MGRLYTGSFAALEGALAEEVGAAKGRHALVPVTVVAGSAAVASYLSHALAHALGGHANVRFVTIHRLAGELAAVAGLSSTLVLTDEARLRLVQRLVAGVCSRPGSYFAPVAGMPGLARAFLRSLNDLREAGVAAGADWGPLSPRLADMRATLAAYELALGSAGCADRAGVYAAAVQALQSSGGGQDGPLPAGGAVMIYGLYDLPQCQRRFLEALAALCPLSAFVPSAVRGEEYAQAGLRFLAGLGLQPVSLPPSNEPPPELLSVGDDGDEVLEVRRRLQELTAAGVRYNQVLVVAPHEQRAQELALELQALGAPAARRLPPAGGAAARLLGLLNVAFPEDGRPWARAALTQFAAAMAAAGGGPQAADVARWTEESRQAGVVAADDWSRLQRRQSYLKARVADLRAGPADPEEPDSAGALAATQMRLNAVQGLTRFVNGLRAAVERLPERGAWPHMVAAFTALAVEHCAVAADDPVLQALAELRRCALVEDEVGAADVARTAADRLRRLTEPHGAAGRGGVSVLTPHEARGLRFHAVLFTGLHSGGFPSIAAHDPIVPDQDRQHLAQRLQLRLAEVSEREREADLLFALARQAARHSFTAFVARRDASGKERQPSRLAVELAEELSGRIATGEDFARAPLAGASLRRVPSGLQPAALTAAGADLPGGRRPADLRDLDVAVLLALHGSSDRQTRVAEAPHAYLAQVCGAATARRLLGRRLAGVSPALLAWDGVFQAPAARAALAAAGHFAGPQAPTKLQEYVACPFAFYVLSILGLDPVEEPEALAEADRREVGKVVHRVLQRVFAAVAGGAGPAEAQRLVPESMAAECAAAERRGGVGLPLVWRAQAAQLAEDLILAVLNDPCWSLAEGPQPWQFELDFGEGEAPVALRLADGQNMLFRGRIDRMNVSPDGRRFRVLDYKSGRGGAEAAMVQAGRNIQLPVYLLAARALVAPNAQASIECAFRMVTRERQREEVLLPADEAVVLRQLADTVSAVKRLSEKGVFPRMPAQDQRCEWCRVAYACDELKATRELKQAQTGLAGLQALRQQVAADDRFAPAPQTEGAAERPEAEDADAPPHPEGQAHA